MHIHVALICGGVTGAWCDSSHPIFFLSSIYLREDRKISVITKEGRGIDIRRKGKAQ